MGYLFTLFSFDTQNFLILIRSNLSILLLPLVFVSYSRNHWQMKLFYMFSSKSLIILTLTLRSWIHFELIFAYDIREGSNFTLPCRFPEHHLSKRIYFPHWVVLTSLSKIIWLYVRRFISGLSLLYNVSLLSWLTIILKKQRWCVLLQKRKKLNCFSQ